MNSVFLFVQIFFGVLLILCILMQQKGAGLGSSFGGDGGLYRTKRGAEKVLFRATIALSILFMLSILLGFVG